MSPDLYHVFLSYGSDDKAEAKQIYDCLTAANLKVWWDKVSLESAMRWHDEIERHCESSRVVIPLLTPEWKDSTYCRYETYGAEHILPIKLRGDIKEVLTEPLAQYQLDTFDLATATDADWQRLIARIRTLCGQPRPRQQDRQVLLKHRTNPHFVGRDQTLVDLHEKLFLNRMTALTHGGVIAIPALGGVGKTTLARHYAEKFWRCYPRIFWIDCRSGIQTGFVEIHDFLKLGPLDDPFEQRAQRAKRELEQHGKPQTLLILDNAEDEASVTPWIPATGDCHVLITSRFTAWSKTIETHPVWVLDPEPAKQLLLKRGNRTSDDAASTVGRKLGYLPLALEQAAAYVEQQDITYAKYLELYEAKEQKFLDKSPPGATDYPASVYLTWRTTIDKLPDGARAMLRLHAFFAPTPFPVKLYVDGAKELVEEIQAAGGTATIADEDDVLEWRTALVNYSMAKKESDECISVHALVQTVERHYMGDRAPEVARRAATMYVRVTPEPTWDLPSRANWAKLIEHSRALGDCHWVGDVTRGELYNDLANTFFHAGNYGDGVAAATRSLEARERVFEPEHVDTLSAVGWLAELLRLKGDYAAAEPLYRRGLATCERALGLDHHNTLASINNLAMLLHRKGDYAAAELLFRRGMEGCERVFGLDHPNTLQMLNNFAELQRSKADFATAEHLHRRTLEARDRVLGPEHPHTLMSVNNLAMMLMNKRDYTAAEHLHRRALEAFERVRGPEHPDTLTSVNNLAELLNGKGDFAAAEYLFRRAIEGRERVLGPRHLDTLMSINNLANLLYSKGDYAAAEPLYRRAVEEARKVLGPDHPDTKDYAQNLQNCLDALSRQSGNSDQ